MSAIHDILKQNWGYDTFRHPQENIIQEVLEGRDILALMPTGGGKSICYQVPGLFKEGVCIVITPLVALMKDQVYQLKERGIIAYSIHSGLSKREIDIILDNCIFGKVKFLYVSPERLQTELFLARFERMNVNLIAVDEAHCITQWGYDFRPSYLNIKEIRALKKDVPLIALTASATENTIEDIQEQLEFSKLNVIKKSFYRSNLNYYVFQEDNKRERILKMLQKDLGGSAIVYTRNRRATRELCQYLVEHGVESTYYHAGLKGKVKDERQALWLKNKCRVIVCTNAFGMGIDKPDVRLVIHYQMPDTIEAYYQEAGRAGRDGQLAHCIVLYNKRDISGLEKSMEIRFPSLSKVKQAYQVLMNFYQAGIGNNFEVGVDFEIDKLCAKYDLNVNQTYYAIKSLESQGFLSFSDAVYVPSKVQFKVSQSALYGFEVSHRQFEGVIKTLLRSYGGVFDDPIVISEALIAKRAEMDEKKVVEILGRMVKMNIISYQSSNDRPKIWFMKGRKNAEALEITDESIRNRKKVMGEKLARMIEYVKAEDICRNKMILHYFDEPNLSDCGHCDVCIRNKVTIEPKDKILRFCADGTKSVQEIINACQGKFEEKEIMEEIRLMLDESILLRNEEGGICLNQ